jgi:hypothetical protein
MKTKNVWGKKGSAPDCSTTQNRMAFYHSNIVVQVPSVNSGLLARGEKIEKLAGSRRVLATGVDNGSENLLALAPIQAYAYVQ